MLNAVLSDKTFWHLIIAWSQRSCQLSLVPGHFNIFTHKSHPRFFFPNFLLQLIFNCRKMNVCIHTCRRSHYSTVQWIKPGRQGPVNFCPRPDYVFGKLALVLSSIEFSPAASTVAHAGRRMLGGLGWRHPARPMPTTIRGRCYLDRIVWESSSSLSTVANQ